LELSANQTCEGMVCLDSLGPRQLSSNARSNRPWK